ncbi:MAG: hypothetical protein WAM92_04015 [Mycobacterium sp.]
MAVTVGTRSRAHYVYVGLEMIKVIAPLPAGQSVAGRVTPRDEEETWIRCH